MQSKSEQIAITPDTLVLNKSQKEIDKFKWGVVLQPFFMLIFIMLFFQVDTFNNKVFIFSIMAFAILLSLLFWLYLYVATRRGQVVVNTKGIGFQSNLPRFFQGWIPIFSPKDWFANWSEVTTLQVKQSDQSKVQPGPRFIELKIHTKPQPPPIFPYQWVDPKNPSFQPQGFNWRLKLPDADEITKAVLLSPLMKYVALHKIPDRHNIHLLIDFDLDKSWANTRILMGVLIIFLLMMAIVSIGSLTEWDFLDTRPSKIVEADATTKSQYTLPDSLKYKLVDHTDNVLPIAFSPDGTLLASSGKDKQVRLWSIATGETQHILKGHAKRVQALTFSPDSKWLVSSGNDNTIRIWDTKTGKIEKTLENAGQNGIYALSVNLEGSLLASGDWDSSITLWQFPEGKRLYQVLGEAKGFLGFGKGTGPGHHDSVNSVAFSPNGTLLASGSFDETAKLWQVQANGSLTLLQTLEAEDWITVVCFSPDGHLLAGGGFDKQIHLWQVVDGQLLRNFFGHEQTVAGLAFHPEGRMIASGSFDRTVKIWETTTGHLLADLSGHDDYVNSVAFSPDGTLLASGSGDDTVRVWWHQ